MHSLNIYNIFPKLYKNSGEWKEYLDKIVDMGFNCVFINPIHYPGFSGSIYAIKDYYEYNDDFFTKESPPEEQLKDFLNACKERNLDVLMDLVVNHTSIDSILINEHKDWYRRNEEGEIENPGAWEDGNWMTWGDLATFDLENSSDKNNLWNYLFKVCRHFIRLGFTGFRCDAAYQVNSDFWNFLISNIREERRGTIFIAETLGCAPVQIQSLALCGFNYIFNSSKWWNFTDSWCLEQYELTQKIAPSISFPETHDTIRLMNEVGGDEKLFLQKLYFTAIFSKGFMISTGFEFGFKKRISSVKTVPQDWENTGKDYSKNIKEILKIKEALLPLREESPIEIVRHINLENVFCFYKEWNNQRVFICINKDTDKVQGIMFDNLEDILRTEKIKDYSPENKIKGYIQELNINLDPSEVKIFAGEKDYIL